MKIVTYNADIEAREEILRRLARALAQCPELVFAFAHGSFLDPGPYRDLDLAVYHQNLSASDRDHRYEAKLELNLHEALGLPCPVDVRLLNDAPVAFCFQAVRGRLLLDRDPDLRIAFSTRTAMRYLDMVPILHHHAREAFCHDAEP